MEFIITVRVDGTRTPIDRYVKAPSLESAKKHVRQSVAEELLLDKEIIKVVKVYEYK